MNDPPTVAPARTTSIRPHWRVTVTRALVWTIAGSLLPLTVTSFLAFDQARRSARSGAIEEATQYGEFIARNVLAPLVTPELMAGDKAALAVIDGVVKGIVTSGSTQRIKIWSDNSVIVYSDEPALIGQQFALEAEDVAILESGGTQAGISELERPENLFEDLNGRLLEVYVGSNATDGSPVLIESYFDYDLVEGRAQDLRRRFVPILLVGLVALAAVQIPLAAMLASRLRRGQRDRNQLLERLVSVSDVERRRIAAEVHDGAVQDLAGVGFALGAVARQVDGDAAVKLDGLSATVSSTVRQLRSLLTSIYPVEVPPEGVAAGLTDLVDVLRAQGARVTVDIPRRLDIRPAAALLVLRVARELLRNVIAHAQASEVIVRVRLAHGLLSLELTDDGVGFSVRQLEERRREGHLGLALLVDLVTDAGGHLDIASEPGEGMRARLELMEQT